MADSLTTLYGLVKPEVGASADSWGSKLNNDFTDLDAMLGAFALTGSSSAYVLTTGMSLAAYAANQKFLIRWNHTNGGAATLNVDGLGAKSIVKRDGSTAVSASDLVSNAYAIVIYNGTAFVLLTVVASDFQPLDPTLTALAALSYTSGTLHVTLTAADTFTLMADTALVHTTGAETVAGAKTFTSAAVVSLNSGALPTASSGTVMRVAGADSAAARFCIEAYQGNPILEYRRANGTAASPTAVAATAILGGQNAIGYGSTAYSGGSRAGFTMNASETWTDSAQGAHVRLMATRKGAATQIEVYRWGDIEASNEVGYRDGGPGSVPDAAYDFALTDRGTPTDHTSSSAHTYRVRTNANVAQPVNAILYGTNWGSGTLTIGRESGVAIRNAAGTDGDLSVPQYGRYVVQRHPTSADVWTGRVF